MREALPKDPSTLASLAPNDGREIHYRSYRTSPRLSGSHFMTLRRPSRTPESGREYVPGDPINLIDWKAYARTDQLIVREVRDEASARIRIGVDLSETMRWPQGGDTTVATPPSTKGEIAVRVALNLAHLHLRMGDLVELWVVGSEGAKAPERLLKPRSPADVLAAFERLSAHGYCRAEALAELDPAPFLPRDVDGAFWVGDALSGADFGAFLGQGKRSLFVHVLSSLETDIGWIEGTTSYFDEGAGRKEYQGQVLRHRDNYLKHLAGWRQKLESKQRRRGGVYVQVTDKTRVATFHQAAYGFISGRA